MDPQTQAALMPVLTSLAGLVVGYLLRHMTSPKADPQHPFLSALEQAVWQGMGQNTYQAVAGSLPVPQMQLPALQGPVVMPAQPK